MVNFQLPVCYLLSLVKYFRYVVVSECQALRQSDGDDLFYIRNHGLLHSYRCDSGFVHHLCHYYTDAYIWIYIWRVTLSLMDSLVPFARSMPFLEGLLHWYWSYQGVLPHI